MKKTMLKGTTTIVAALAMAGLLLSGCKASGDAAPVEEDAAPVEEAAAPVQEADAPAQKTAEAGQAPYFTRGVYVNYAKEAENPPKTYFYVFSADNYGYTADGENGGIGVPFDVTEQADGVVKLSFGGAEENEDTIVITGTDNGTVYGYFKDVPERELVFEPVEGADPDTFSAENYVNGPEDSIYHDALGWSVRYDATRFEVTNKAPDVFIVYTGESAGTNMITATYTVDSNAEDAIQEMGESYGGDAIYTEGPFPGADDVTGYFVTIAPDTEGSGAYMSALARDFKDGALIFRIDGHNGEDEGQNMEVSDYIAGVIDSLSFE